uniref:Uncharacterized protein n=1 Tax=Anguilla anguilla TaxID=7936 RepID=A0A0E9QU83_ANGAN
MSLLSCALLSRLFLFIFVLTFQIFTFFYNMLNFCEVVCQNLFLYQVFFFVFLICF